MTLPDPVIGGGSSGPGAVTTAAPSSAANIRNLQASLSDVSDFLADRVRTDEENQSKITAVKRKIQYRAEVTKYLAEADATQPDYLERTSEFLAQTRDEALRDTGISSDYIYDGLELDLSDLEQTALDASAASRRGALENDALLTRDDLERQTLEQIRDDHANAGLYIADFQAAMEGLAPSIAPTKLAALEDDFAQKVVGAKVEGMIKAEDFTGARQFLDDAGGAIEPDNRRFLGSLVDSAKRKYDKDHALDYSRAFADIDIATALAEDPAELVAIIGKINEMDKAGMFAGKQEKRATLMTQAINKKRTLLNKDKDAVAAVNALAAGPITQAEANDAFPMVMARAEAAGVEGDALVDVAVQFAADAGQVPTKMRERLKAAEQANDPQALAGGATLYRRLTDAVPGVDLGIEPGGRIDAVDTMVRYFGMAPEAAADQVIRQMPDPAARKARGDAWDDLKRTGKDILDQSEVAPDLSNWPFRLGREEIPDEALAEAEKAARQAYILTGDQKTAETMAVKGLSQEGKRWGISYTGEAARVVKFPPEAHFPAFTMPDPLHGRDGLSQEQRAAVLDDIVRARLSAGGWGEHARYTLLPTEDSERRVRAGLRPQYYVSLPSRFGGYAETGPISETLDDGTQRPVIIEVPQTKTDLMNSKTWRNWLYEQERAVVEPRSYVGERTTKEPDAPGTIYAIPPPLYPVPKAVK